MAYKVVEIYKDLPRKAGCKECGKPGCFAFATGVHLEGLSLDRCPHLTPAELDKMQALLSASRAEAGGVAGEAGDEDASPEAEAAKMLQAEVAQADLARLAEASGATYHAGPPESIEVPYLDRTFRLTHESVAAVDDGEIDVWLKVVLLMYVTRATGTLPDGEWIAYRELPNTLSKQTTYEKWVNNLADAYAGKLDELEAAATAAGGDRVGHESADLALRFQALPRVGLLLLLWDADADFEARGSLLLDRGVLDYLDQEALTFLSEALMRRFLSTASP